MGQRSKEGIAMPKEFIGNYNPEEDDFVAVVGWQPDHYMQVGIQVTDPDKTLLDHLYGSDQQAEGIGRMLVWWIKEELPKRDIEQVAENDDLCTTLGREVLSWVEGQRIPVERDGIWVTPSRYEANAFVRFVRKARNAVFGSDE